MNLIQSAKKQYQQLNGVKKLLFWEFFAFTGLMIGIGGYYFLTRGVAPTQMVCPISPVRVTVPECELYVGQPYQKHLYELVPAVKLEKNEIGLYKNASGELITFSDVGFNPYPASRTVVYPQDVLLYKTERETTDPEKCPERLTQYGLCDTPVDNVVFGEGVEGEVDLAIEFKVEATPDNLAQLYDIGGLDRLIDLLKQVVRGNRQLSTIRAEDANTEEGSKQIEQAFRQVLSSWAFAYLLNVETITVRSVTVGSQQYRQQREAQAARVSQQDLEEKSLEFERTQLLQDAETFAQSIQVMCQNIPPDRCPELIWVLTYGDQVQPFFQEYGMPDATSSPESPEATPNPDEEP